MFAVSRSQQTHYILRNEVGFLSKQVNFFSHMSKKDFLKHKQINNENSTFSGAKAVGHKVGEVLLFEEL